jgi:hypothetical protein
VTPPEPHDHVTPTDADVPDGTYRVVGAGDETVTLLRVADGSGRRRHTGTVVTVERESFASFASAENPDGNRPTGERVASWAATRYWSLRAFATQLRANPVPSAGATAVLLAGLVGERAVTLPAVAFGALVLLGSLALAYVGSGRA